MMRITTRVTSIFKAAIAKRKRTIMEQIQYPEAAGSEVIIPLKAPYVLLPEPKADEMLQGAFGIKLPPLCAWCGSEQVAGSQRIRFVEANPAYRPHGQRLLMEGISLAAGAAAGNVLVYGAMRPEDAAKVKGLSLVLSVPCCAAHSDASPTNYFSFEKNRLKVRDSNYARTIARINNPAISLATLDELSWPNQCVVCGLPNATEKYQVEVQLHSGDLVKDMRRISTKPAEEPPKVEVPVCENDLKQLTRKKGIGNFFGNTSVIIGIGLGILTLFIINTSIGNHLLYFGGSCFVGAGIWMGLGMLIGALSVRGKDSPVSISRSDDGTYRLVFKDLDAAETYRRANGLIDDEEDPADRVGRELLKEPRVTQFYRDTAAVWKSGKLSKLSETFERNSDPYDMFMNVDSFRPAEGTALHAFFTQLPALPGEFLVGRNDWFVLTNRRLIQKDGATGLYREVVLSNVASFDMIAAETGAFAFKLNSGEVLNFQGCSYYPKNEYLQEAMDQSKSV